MNFQRVKPKNVSGQERASASALINTRPNNASSPFTKRRSLSNLVYQTHSCTQILNAIYVISPMDLSHGVRANLACLFLIAEHYFFSFLIHSMHHQKQPQCNDVKPRTIKLPSQRHLTTALLNLYPLHRPSSPSSEP